MRASPNDNPVAAVIGKILDMKHEVSLISEHTTYPLRAYVASISPGANMLALHTFCEASELERYVSGGIVTFDFERLRDGDEADILSFERMPAEVVKQRENLFEIRCRLPHSIIVTERRGGIRVPLIQGMYARAQLQVYPDHLAVTGQVRDLSVGGCLVDVSIRDSAALATGQTLPEVRLDFPNGAQFIAACEIRHMRPLGSSGRIALGIQFLDTGRQGQEHVRGLVHEAERELAYRTGMDRRAAGISPLFVPSREEQQLQEQSRLQRELQRNQPTVVATLREVTHQLQIVLLFLKSRQTLPETTLYNCADMLLLMLGQKRRQLLFALAALQDEPQWVGHAVRVAVRLADMLGTDNAHVASRRDAVAGALLHTMGKPLMLCDALPTLEGPLSAQQEVLLRGHVNALTTRLNAMNWRPQPVTWGVIKHAHECLDGSGYPMGKQDSALSMLVRLLGVIKAVDHLTHGGPGYETLAPLDAYRTLYKAPDRYDRKQVVAYVKRYGPCPIGSLARYSRGFLAWIMDTDREGQPAQVQVVKNLAYPDTHLNTIIQAADLHQIGELERIVDPRAYQLSLRWPAPAP